MRGLHPVTSGRIFGNSHYPVFCCPNLVKTSPAYGVGTRSDEIFLLSASHLLSIRPLLHLQRSGNGVGREARAWLDLPEYAGEDRIDVFEVVRDIEKAVDGLRVEEPGDLGVPLQEV
jgi:hypothetical protein